MQLVGWVGLGAMGHAMATNLHQHLTKDGQALQIFNRNRSKCDLLVSAGAKQHNSMQELYRACQARPKDSLI